MIVADTPNFITSVGEKFQHNINCADEADLGKVLHTTHIKSPLLSVSYIKWLKSWWTDSCEEIHNIAEITKQLDCSKRWNLSYGPTLPLWSRSHHRVIPVFICGCDKVAEISTYRWWGKDNNVATSQIGQLCKLNHLNKLYLNLSKCKI